MFRKIILICNSEMTKIKVSQGIISSLWNLNYKCCNHNTAGVSNSNPFQSLKAQELATKNKVNLRQRTQKAQHISWSVKMNTWQWTTGNKAPHRTWALEPSHSHVLWPKVSPEQATLNFLASLSVPQSPVLLSSHCTLIRAKQNSNWKDQQV